MSISFSVGGENAGGSERVPFGTASSFMLTVAMAFYVYLLASHKNGTLYCGHTDDIAFRTWNHKKGRGSVFTRKYGVTRLVWYELHGTREAAKNREYQIKKWERAWKIRMIEETNPEWLDLYNRLNH